MTAVLGPGGHLDLRRSGLSNFWLALHREDRRRCSAFFLVVPLVVGYMEHKVLAHMQARLGPMEAGIFHGWAQLVADGVKFVQKEDVVPAAADRRVFSLAPAVAMVPYIVDPGRAAVQPHAVRAQPRRRHLLRDGHVQRLGDRRADGGVVEREQVLADRRAAAAAQLIAYELPLVLAAAAVVMQAGTLSLVGIVEAQERCGTSSPLFRLS